MFKKTLFAFAVLATMTSSALAQERTERRGQSEFQCVQSVKALCNNGTWIPVFVKGYVENNQVRYDTVFEKLEGLAWQHRIGMNDTFFEQYNRDFTDSGFTLVSRDRYLVGNEYRNAAIWHKRN